MFQSGHRHAGGCGYGRPPLGLEPSGDIVRYPWEVSGRADVLIRDVPDDVLRAIDADAKRQGLSRSEYLRHSIERTARTPEASVTVPDLEAFSEACADPEDPK